MQAKLIREGRFGPPKCFKTGAILGSYPKPLLVFCFDSGGLDVLPPAGYKPVGNELLLDASFEDVTWVDPKALSEWCQLPPDKLPKITALDFFSARVGPMSEQYKPVGQAGGLREYIHCVNLLSGLKEKCPWRTIVIDPITGFTEMVHMHIAATNAKSLEDARKWAPDIGYQVLKTVGALSMTNAHCVFIFHSTVTQNELTSSVLELPMVPSTFARDRIGGMLQQWFYATKENGKPVIYTTDKGYVRGIGARWPGGLPGVCGPLFKDIYERH